MTPERSYTVLNADTRMPGFLGHRPTSSSRMAAQKPAAIDRKRQIKESGIEQTVVAFDVTLQMPTSQQGAAAFCAHQPEGQALPVGKSWGVRRDPQASGLAAGFFFSGRRNEFAAIRIALVRKAGILPRNVSSRNNPICRSIRPSYAGPDGDGRANEIDRLVGRRTPDRSICEPVFLHVFRAINVSEIDHHRASHQVAHAFKIERTELFPLGNDHNGVRFFDALIGISTIGDVDQDLLGLLHSRPDRRRELGRPYPGAP